MSGERSLDVPLRDVLRLALDPVPVRPELSYPMLGVYGFGRGVIADKPSVSGSNLSAAVLYRVKAGQFIYSKLKAFEGAFALVPDKADGRFVSNEFPTFECDVSRLRPDYLAWLFRWPVTWERISRQSTGIGARRERVHPEMLLNFTLALPSLSFQEQVVQRLNAAAKAAAEHATAGESAEVEVRFSLQQALRTLSSSCLQLAKVLRLRPTDTVVQPDKEYSFAGVYSFARGVFRGATKKGADFAYDRLTRLRTGDFVYPKLMAWEGALGVVPASCDGCYVSPEFPVFEVNTDEVLPEILELHFSDPANWPKSTGTNVRRKRVHPNDFLALDMPHLPMTKQKSLAEACRKAAAAVAARREAGKELEKLLPAMLHEAFAEGREPPARAAA